ncbi:MAG: phosphatidate cytidylyltransferase [Candidatus Korobacteraceae bacterium]
MKRVITAVILIPIVVVALFKAPLWLFTLLVFGVATLATHEYLGIAKAQGFQPMVVAGYVFVTLSIAWVYAFATMLTRQPTEPLSRTWSVFLMLGYTWGLPAIAFLAPILLLAIGLERDPLSKVLPDAAVSYLVVPYVGFTLGILIFLRSFPNGALYVLFLMLLVWCGDIAAYYVGRAAGKHKLAPRISPGKTWEGAIASVLAAIVVGALLFRFMNPISDALQNLHLFTQAPHATIYPPPSGAWAFPMPPFFVIALFAICVNVAAQLGDLVESAMKRGAGIKDSGTLLPGHGGVLDRIDALLFALPVGLIFYVAGMARYFEPVVSSR